MAKELLGKTALAAGVLAALVVLALAALPLLASTATIRNRIASELSSLTGYRVELASAPEITLFPNPAARLRNVRFRHWGSVDEAAVAEAEEITVTLSAWAAVSGQVRFTDLTILHPVLHLEPGQDGPVMPVLPEGGRIASGIRTAGDAVKLDPLDPDLSFLPDDALGTIEIIDGRIITGRNGLEEPVISGIEARISWPKLSSAASGTFECIWSGEPMKAGFSVSQPLLILGGGTGTASISVDSKLASLTFDGKLSNSAAIFADGDVRFSTSSLARFLRWAGVRDQALGSIGTLKIVTRVAGDMTRAKFDNTGIELGGNPATGVLEFSSANGTPSLSGTLAFRELDLLSLLSLFSNLPAETQSAGVPIEKPMARNIELDLRLSAEEAKLGLYALSEVAATAQIKGGLTAFDISDASAFGGTIQAGLRIDRKPEGDKGEIRVLATDIDTGLAADASGVTRLLPRAKGTVSLILQGTPSSWQSFIEKSGGSFSAKLKSGTVQKLSMPEFLKRSGESGFFSLNEVGNGSLDFSSFEFEAQLAEGAARIQKARMTTADSVVTLNGVIPYAARSLALSGAVSSLAGDKAPLARFFAGGSWQSPFIAPISNPGQAGN